MIETILKRMQTRYSRMLDTYYPAFETTGFTERNLTFNFCHEALSLNDNLIVWQEAPFCNKSEHLDSIIFDDVDKHNYISLCDTCPARTRCRYPYAVFRKSGTDRLLR